HHVWAQSPGLFEDGVSERGQSSLPFGFASRFPPVAFIDGSVGLAPSRRLSYCFNSGSDRRGAAFIEAASNEVVDLREEFLGEPNGDLFRSRSHETSIPERDALWYAHP